jgi:hypothetical protein
LHLFTFFHLFILTTFQKKKMKFTILAVFSSAVAAVYAQATTTTQKDAGVAINVPSFGVRKQNKQQRIL